MISTYSHPIPAAKARLYGSVKLTRFWGLFIISSISAPAGASTSPLLELTLGDQQRPVGANSLAGKKTPWIAKVQLVSLRVGAQLTLITSHVLNACPAIALLALATTGCLTTLDT